MNDSRTRLWVGLFVTLVFVCGLSMGVALAPLLGPPSVGRDGFQRSMRPGGPRGGGAFVSERILRRLEEDPTFTDEQRDRLTTLFTDREERFVRFNREMRQRFESERSRLRDDVATILTPEQMQQFESVRDRARGRRGRESYDRRR